MVARSDELDALREYVVQSGGSFLRNVQWRKGVTCRICAGVVTPGYAECRACSPRSGTPGPADDLGFVTYAWRLSQAGQVMRAYKAGGQTSHQLVRALLAYAVVAHWPCIALRADSPPDGWAVVPSLSGRPGPHPLQELAEPVMIHVPHVSITANAVADEARTFNPAHFGVPATTATHVVLLDDTWASGGHFQSASAALKRAGVNRVTGLVIARWLEPEWGRTQRFIEGLPPGFDPDLCPFTGRPCR